MPENLLPADGTVRVGQVSMPAGRRIAGRAGPVAWVTDEPVEEPGLLWSTLSADSTATGLVPFLAASLEDEGTRAQVAESLALAAGAGLDSDYEDYPADDDYDSGDDDSEGGGPFGERGRPWANGGFDDPADITGLSGFDAAGLQEGSGTLPVAAVLRSWEDRFGARLLRIGFAQISLLATRPPRDLESIQLLAAEHLVFCNECGGLGLSEISTITRYLMASPVWTFWWD
jgi:hypothetical protein